MSFLLDPEIPQSFIVLVKRDFVCPNFSDLHPHTHAIMPPVGWKNKTNLSPVRLSLGPQQSYSPAQSSMPHLLQPSPPAETSATPAVCQLIAAVSACHPSRSSHPDWPHDGQRPHSALQCDSRKPAPGPCLRPCSSHESRQPPERETGQSPA